MSKRTVTLYPPGGGPPVEALSHPAAAMEARGWTRAPRENQELAASGRSVRIETAMRRILADARQGSGAANMTASGKPRVEDIEAVAGIADVSAAERDAIWAHIDED